MTHSFTLIPGDGVGPELCEVARRAVEATGLDVDWDVQEAGAASLATEGTLLPDRVIASIADRGVALKGPIATPVGHPSPNVALRRELDLYANVRPVRAPARRGTGPPIDLVVIRMTLEDLTAGIDFPASDSRVERLRDLVRDTHGIDLGDDVGVSLKPITRSQARRLHEAAFAYAEEHGRHRVTSVHKATNQPATDGAFLAAGREVAANHPEVRHDDRLVDALCHDLARKPDSYDVVATPAQYGDIVSDLAAGLAGGLGLAPSANVGERAAVFEAVHGTAPRLAGRNVANPFALVGAAAMLLRHVEEHDAASRLDAAMAALIDAGSPLTYDLDRSGRPATTAEVGAALENAIRGGT